MFALKFLKLNLARVIHSVFTRMQSWFILAVIMIQIGRGGPPSLAFVQRPKWHKVQCCHS
jgi:hypothetical protein